MAIMVGVELVVMGYKPVILPFAAPKVGNDAYRSWANNILQTDALAEGIDNGSINRIAYGLALLVHKDDYVPLLPPTLLYQQPGVEFYIDAGDAPHFQLEVYFLGKWQYHTLLSVNWFEFNHGFLQDALHKTEHENYLVDMSTGCPLS